MLRPYMSDLNINIIGTVLPGLIEEYGENKKIDLFFSQSHSLFKKAYPKAKMSGVYIDKNGNWKIQANVFAVLMVERT